MTSSTLMWTKRSSRASSVTGSIRFTSSSLSPFASKGLDGVDRVRALRLPGRCLVRGSYDHSSDVMASGLGRSSASPSGRLAASAGGCAAGPWWP